MNFVISKPEQPEPHYKNVMKRPQTQAGHFVDGIQWRYSGGTEGYGRQRYSLNKPFDYVICQSNRLRNTDSCNFLLVFPLNFSRTASQTFQLNKG